MIVENNQKLSVRLRWEGDIDLDLSAFELGGNRLVMEDGGVVFYNSLSRSEAYDESHHGDMQRWRDVTVPMSPDGAIIGSADVEGDNVGSSVETMSIDLGKIGEDVMSVVVCVTSCAKSSSHPSISQAQGGVVSVHGHGGETLRDCDLTRLSAGARGYEFIELQRRHDGRWSIEEVDEFHEGALNDLLDKYV